MENKDVNRAKNSISIKLLIELIFAFAAGYCVHNFILNASNSDIYSFSTPDLINIILSVLLSGASIILAISAISLGKFSEDAMIRRSDQSIKLQSSVFEKTIQALQRIESSTGVTEKRIEDIIAGRVGEVAKNIARIANEPQTKEGVQPGEIEDLIRKTLLKNYIGSRIRGLDKDNPEESDKEKQSALIRDFYSKSHNNLENSLIKSKELRAAKLGSGSSTASGLKLFDFVFINKADKKIGIMDFSSDFSDDAFQAVIAKGLDELQKSTVDILKIVFYEHIDNLEKVYADMISIIDPALKVRISLTILIPEEIENFIKEMAE